MSFGLAVYNDWGTVQVDENWPAMSLRLKLVVSVATSSNEGYYTDLRFTAAAPMLFWKAGAPIYIISSLNHGDGTWTFRLKANDVTTATVYIFDTPEWFPQSSGFEVFNANGVKVFGDQMSQLKLAAVVPISAVPQSYAGLAPGNYAVCTSDPGFTSNTYFADIERTESLSVGAQETSQGFICDWVVSKTGYPFVINNAPVFASQFMLIADVTGL